MPLTERELWLLNLYRNSELHGALLMGRLARSLRHPELLVNVTRHCATEARHAALLTELIAELGSAPDPAVDTIQQHYSAEGGVPKETVDLLVLSDVLERRVLLSYDEHLRRDDIHPRVRQVLTEIIREEEEHGGTEDAWLEQALAAMPAAEVAAARAKWRGVDERVVARLHEFLRTSFPAPEEVRA